MPPMAMAKLTQRYAACELPRDFKEEKDKKRFRGAASHPAVERPPLGCEK